MGLYSKKKRTDSSGDQQVNADHGERTGLDPGTVRDEVLNILDDEPAGLAPSVYQDPDLYSKDAHAIVDEEMKVNDSLVDNSFRQRDLPVALRRPADGWKAGIIDLCHGKTEKWLYSTGGIQCNVQWLAAFLSQFGAEWTQLCLLKDADPFSNPVAHTVQIQALLQVTVPLGTGTTKSLELRSFLAPVNPFILSLANSTYVMHDFVFAYSFRLSQKALLGLKSMTIFLNEALNSMDSSTLDALMGQGVNALNDTTVGSIAAFLILLNEQNEKWAQYRNFVKEQKTENSIPMSLLLQQIELESEEDPDSILDGMPIPKHLCSVLLWEKETNESLLQASVHVDNILALEVGSLSVKISSSPNDILGQHYRIERKLGSEYGSRRGIFIGCIAETVRSFLAKCYDSGDVGQAVNWNPALQKNVFAFRLSGQLADRLDMFKAFSSSVGARMLWECQFNLQTKIALRPAEKNVAEDSWLMMLFLLGFPALAITASANAPRDMYEFIISPVQGPAAIRIRMRCNKESRQTTLDLLSNDACIHFSWNDWRNAISGRIFGRNAYVASFLRQKGREPRVNLLIVRKNSNKISSDFVSEGGVSWWTGWPPMYPRFAKYEMSQLVSNVDTVTLVSEESFPKRNVRSRTVEKAEEFLFHVFNRP